MSTAICASRRGTHSTWPTNSAPRCSWYPRARFATTCARYPRTEILFSNKANNNPAVRRIFNQEGAGGDCFGYGELYLSLLAGTDPGKLMLNGSNKQAPELTLAVESGVTINLDSLEETDQVADLARKVGRRA